MVRFYSPKFLLDMKDRNGDLPEIFISMGNRTSGKTFGIGNEVLIPGFIKEGKKFALLVRWQRELGNAAEGVFKAVLEEKYPEYMIKEQVMGKGVYSNLYLVHKEGEDFVEEHCGYVLPINNATPNIKPISSIFSDVEIMFMDEFQTTKYCPNEVSEFISLHTSVARGKGKAVRYVPVILCSNAIDITNPYFISLKILRQLQPDTKKLRGEGWVLEIFLNTDVQKEQEASAFNRAFADEKAIKSAINNMWLLGNSSCICKPDSSWGRSIYYCTIQDEDTKYGVRFYPQVGIYYINYSVDMDCKYKYNISLDGELNVPLLKTSSMIKILRENFANGAVRMKDPKVKEMVLKTFV